MTIGLSDIDPAIIAKIRASERRKLKIELERQWSREVHRLDALARQRQACAFTNAEFRQISAALHPDSSPEQRSKAFIQFNAKEDMLREPPLPMIEPSRAPPPPKPREEMLARKAAKAAKP